MQKINGNTYFLAGPTNIGIFLFKNKYTLLVDTGESKGSARQIAEKLNQRGWQIKYIFNTHEHPDHYGGNPYLGEAYSGSVFYASAQSRLFMENNFLTPMYMYGGHPPGELARYYTQGRAARVNALLEAGPVKINDERFETIALGGHAPGHTGLATRDRVCFLGDALFSPEIISKYSFPFLYDIDDQLHTMNKIASLEYDFYLLGHAPHFYSYQELQEVLQINRNNLEKHLELILDLLAQPKTREGLLEEVVIMEDLELDFKEYFYLLSTLGAFLTHLTRRGEIKHQLESGRLYYFRE